MSQQTRIAIVLRYRSMGSLLAAVLAGVAVVVLSGCHAPQKPDLARSFVVGGPCRYDVSAGIAQILAVHPGVGAVEMDIGLSMPAAFKPAAWWHQKEWRISVVGPPGLPNHRWLVTNGMLEGARYPIELSVIREGTCTPVLLRFPGRAWDVQ
jgi:hypothetical protein